MRAVLRDLRHAVRLMLEAKGWTVVVLLSLALGIGAGTALFTAVNALLLQTISVADPEGIVRLGWFGDNEMVRSSSEYGYAGETEDGERKRSTFSYPAFEQLRAANETLVDMFASAPYSRVNVVVDGQAEIASAFMASGSYFGVLGLSAAAGRTIGPSDDAPAADPVAMISHGYWERRFGRSDGAIGKIVTINNVMTTIVGVTPADYGGVQGAGSSAADVHLPLSLDSALSGKTRMSEATWWWLQIMGRLKPGVEAAQVRGNLEGVFQAAAQQGMDSFQEDLSPEERALSRNQDRKAVPRLSVESGRRGVYDTRPSTKREATLLGWVVVLVLLIVCANVANLLLSRGAVRERELSIRMSMGATRWRLVRQLVTESVLLATIGGVLGLLVVYWARRLLPFGQDAPLGWRVFGFVAVLSVLTGLAFSLVPAIRATKLELAASLKENSSTVRGSRALLGRGLLVVQVAVSLVLLVGAGLFLNTLRNLRSVDVGFDPSNILLFRLNPTLNGYEGERIPLLYRQLRDELEALAGVQSASLSQAAFLSGSTWTSTLHVEGRGEDESTSAHMMTVSSEFFDTMKIPLLTGRLFEARDDADSAPVAVVNSAAVRELGLSDNPLGQRFGSSPESRSVVEVVGVVGNVKYQNVREEAPPTVYRPYLQDDVDSMTFELKTAIDPRAVIPAAREAVRAIDPNLPLMDVSTQREQIEGRLRQERLFAMAYALFGGLAMLLAAIGLFGVASYNVARRTNEIGVRMALGARRRDVVRMVLGESMMLVAVGILLGVVAALAAGRFVAGLLFGIAPMDPLTMVVAVAAMVLVSAVAAFLPARRAAMVDPMVALQYE